MTDQPARRRLLKSKRTVAVDEFGGTPEGALLIVDGSGNRLHVTPPPVATALRYLLARVQVPGERLPGRVALTSALRGEGVSFMTRSLATVVAYDSEASVIVVDLNWRDPPRPDAKPKGAKTTKSKRRQPPPPDNKPALIDVIERGVAVDRIIEQTSNRRLSIVAPGVVARPRRTAIAGSRALTEVIEDLSQRCDHLLLDLPPVLASSDAITLSQLADAYLLVVQQGITSTTQIEAALEELRDDDALGVILNRFDTHVPKSLRRMVGA